MIAHEAESREPAKITNLDEVIEEKEKIEKMITEALSEFTRTTRMKVNYLALRHAEMQGDDGAIEVQYRISMEIYL